MKPLGFGYGIGRQGAKLNYPAALKAVGIIDFWSYDKRTTVDAQSKVSAWAGYVNSVVLAQETLSKKPVKQADGIVFDGSDDILSNLNIPALQQPNTLYLVLKNITWTTNDGIIDGAALGTGYLYQTSIPGRFRVSTDGTTTYIGDDKSNVGKFHIIRIQLNGENGKIQIDAFDAVTGNVGSGNMLGITLGGAAGTANYKGNFLIKELGVSNKVDSETDEKIIYDYLKKQHINANLIAISGQSNAVGYYPDDTILPATYPGYQGRIYIYFNDLTEGNFERMNPAVNCGYDWIADPHDNTGWGAEQSASHNLYDSSGNEVLVVKSGFNGGEIAEWDEGLAPFTELVAGLIKGLNQNDSNISYKTVSAKSLLWIQGESDAIQSTTTEDYEVKLRSVISRLRSSDSRLATIQFVMSKLSDLMTGSSLDATKRGNINTAFANIAADTANCVVLDPDTISGIELRGDNLHYTAASLLKIGEAWHDLMPE